MARPIHPPVIDIGINNELELAVTAAKLQTSSNCFAHNTEDLGSWLSSWPAWQPSMSKTQTRLVWLAWRKSMICSLTVAACSVHVSPCLRNFDVSTRYRARKVVDQKSRGQRRHLSCRLYLACMRFAIDQRSVPRTSVMLARLRWAAWPLNR